MKKTILASAMLSFLMIVSSGKYSQAEIEQLILRVDGLACPFCAYGLEKKITKMEGVSSYDVDMKEGKVFLGFKADEWIRLDEIKKAVKEAGFTLRDITITLAGNVSWWKDNVLGRNNLIIKVQPSGQLFILIEKKGEEDILFSKLKAISMDEKNKVIITGKIYEHKTKELSEKLPLGIIVDKFKVK